MAIGQQLKEAREQKGITIDQVVDSTNIMAKSIIALESDDYGNMPELIYARGFIKTYAAILGVDSAALLEEYSADYRAYSANKPDEMPRYTLPKRKGGSIFAMTPIQEDESPKQAYALMAQSVIIKSDKSSPATESTAAPAESVETSSGAPTEVPVETAEASVAPLVDCTTAPVEAAGASILQAIDRDHESPPPCDDEPATQSESSPTISEDDLFSQQEAKRRAALFTRAPNQSIFSTELRKKPETIGQSMGEKLIAACGTICGSLLGLTKTKSDDYKDLNKVKGRVMLRRVLGSCLAIVLVIGLAFAIRMVYQVTQSNEPISQDPLVPHTQASSSQEVGRVAPLPAPLIDDVR